MKDKITLDRIQLLHPSLRVESFEIYNEICEALKGSAICRFSHTLRTFAEQDKLYHNYGLAIDIVLLKDADKNGTFETASWQTNVDFDGDGIADWMEVVAIFKRYGWDWGGDWKFTDMPHFQKTFGYSIVQLQKMHSDKKFVLKTNYLAL